jgi:hypothetical protein
VAKPELAAQIQNLTSREKALLALDLRKQGWTHAEIAQNLGFKNAAAASRVINSLLNQATREGIAEYRELALGRLDQMRKAIAKKVLAGELQAIDRALRIEVLAARIMGIPLNTSVRTIEQQVQPGTLSDGGGHAASPQGSYHNWSNPLAVSGAADVLEADWKEADDELSL